VQRKSDSHVAEERVAGIGELYRFLIGELRAGVLTHVGEPYWFHGDFLVEARCLNAKAPSAATEGALG
jgi:hypothetical protein